MKQQKLTSMPDTIPTEAEVNRLIEDCGRASAICDLVAANEAWKKIQSFPETTHNATANLKEASQLIREAVAIMASSYYEHQEK
ncbi:MAG: hypothetical protein WBA07_33710 [Rivularia sp. (in: cyanobacteria)]